MRYLAVTGGVVSGLGKGISISSIGVLLKSCGLRVTSIKIGAGGRVMGSPPPPPPPPPDPYLNSDAGTMSPFEHGEVFVLNDGGEVRVDGGGVMPTAPPSFVRPTHSTLPTPVGGLGPG